MSRSRRRFLAESSLGMLGAAAFAGEAAGQQPQNPTPGAPTVFGTAPAVGPEVTAATFVEAEKLVQVKLSPAEREQAAGNWSRAMAPVYERRVGPKKLALEEADAPASVWTPVGAPGAYNDTSVAREPMAGAMKPLPGSDAEIAFSSVVDLSKWVQNGEISSERLTIIYLERLKRFDPQLKCVITLCEEHALKQARTADGELEWGSPRGPLHGIPWGAKDLLDTAGIATTWGAEFYRGRLPANDAAVVRKLNEAGAVLVAKLSLGALALNDVWFGGQTKNPWNLDEGSSGSSAGPGAAVAAGLVGFAMGSETQGSIISPSMRCGVTGLRPTYGRVSRAGAMTLSWTCDKLGPMARSVEDTMLVLQAISGFDGRDTASVHAVTDFWAGKELGQLRVGYLPAWMKEATDVDRRALDVLRGMGVAVAQVELPDWPYDSLNLILFAEAGAAFEDQTLDGRVHELKMQVPDAWPNTFRQSRFLSAVDYVQADRLRRKVAVEVAKVFEQVDLLLVPSLKDEPLVIFNFTGHPSLTLRAGFVEVGEERSDWAPDPARPLKKFSPPRRVPHGVTLVGRLFREADLCTAGMALEKALGVVAERPKGF